jgi:hypothetical protein
VSTLQPRDRVFHLERGVGTVRAIDEWYPWIGQMMAVQFDQPGPDGSYGALVPENDLTRYEEATA